MAVKTGNCKNAARVKLGNNADGIAHLKQLSQCYYSFDKLKTGSEGYLLVILSEVKGSDLSSSTTKEWQAVVCA